MKKFVFTGIFLFIDLESFILFFRSDFLNKSDFYLSFDSDFIFIFSFTDFLDSIYRIFVLDIQSLNDVFFSFDFFRRLNFGKKYMVF